MKSRSHIRCAALSRATSALGLALGGLLLAAVPAQAKGHTHALNVPAWEHTPLNLGSSTHTAVGSAGGSIVRTIVGLAIVLAVIYGLTWVLKQARSRRAPAQGHAIEQIASLPLGTNRSVALVRVGREIHLLGVGEHGVTRLRRFTEAEAAELAIPLRALEGEEPGNTFGSGGPVRPPGTASLIEKLQRMTAR